jgi:SSS family solute:Na+ symporter
MVMIVFSVLLAYVMPGSIIARATAMFMGLCASAFLPAYAHALYAKKPSTTAATWSILTGALIWSVWTVFVHVKESGAIGLSNALFGVPTVLPMPWPVVDPLIVALPASVIALCAGIVVSRRAGA